MAWLQLLSPIELVVALPVGCPSVKVLENMRGVTVKMTVKKRDTVRMVSLLLCLCLIFSFGTPMSAAQSNADVHTSFINDSGDHVNKKVSDRLQQQFKSKDQATFLLKFKEQVDTKKVAAEAEKKAQQHQQTAAQTTLSKRSAIVNALRLNAMETQSEVTNFLDAQKKEGQVKDYHSYYIVNAIAVTGTKEVAERLAAFPEVEKVLPDEVRQLIQTKDEVSNTTAKVLAAKAGQAQTKAKPTATEWGVENINAPEVWEMGYDGTGIVVANIDTGVQWDHPALKEKYRGYNPDDPDNPDHEMNWIDVVDGRDEPYDDQEHGTHTMGTMVGSEPDGSNQVGVAPGAQWIAVQAFTPIGAYDTDLLEAAEWILAPKDADGNPHPEMAPDVVNNSWGGGPGQDEWYMDAVDTWRAAEIFPTFSAGNDGPGEGTVGTPSNYPQSFSVAATNIDDELANFSSRGPGPYEDDLKPNASAPGVNVRSTVPGSDYAAFNGTSMAAPHVSGTVALLRSADASLSVDDLEEILMNTARPQTDDTYPESPNYGYGHGIINAHDAVSSVVDGLGRIQGRVVEEGEDTEPPTFEHEPVSETYAGMDLPLFVDVEDNVSITAVELQYRAEEREDWQTIAAERTSGNYRSGSYQAVIPGEDVVEPGLFYRWRITDYGDNEVTSDTYDVTVKAGISVGYFEDFEAYPVGWTSFGEENSWEWGTPASGPGEAYSGDNVYATNLSGTYNTDEDSTLLMPPIDLPEGNAYLQFKQWYDFEDNWDYGHVVLSTDLENWEQLSEYTGASEGWIDGEVDLSGYAGERVYVGFHMSADWLINYDGWYIDDVTLSDTSLDGAIKAKLPVKPKEETITAKSGAPATKAKIDEKSVDPHKMLPGKVENVTPPVANKDENPNDARPLDLPLSATVNVLETGRSVHTNPADGSYEMMHAAGDYTLRADAYGFVSQNVTAEVPADGTAEANFVLEPLAQGTVTGKVTNEATGEPVEGATLLLMEDALIEPVMTDDQGEFSITAYEGTYTLAVSAPHYYREHVEITVKGDDTSDQDISLKPFIGYPGEIAYDDGTAENARAFYDAGNGWAVKMSLAEGEEKAMVTAGLFRFWDTEWPIPGGEDFQVAIYDDSGPDGAPGEKLAGPIDAAALRTGEWTEVDLSQAGVVVDGDFYMVYIQTDPHPNAPGLAADEDGPNAGRSWQLVGGAWSPAPASEGNYMIRARVNYEVTPPVITSPEDGLHTNEGTLTVTGEAAPSTEVNLFNNGEEVAAAPAADDGTFSIDIDLLEGENVLTAAASAENGTTDPSEAVTVILDQTKPTLSIDTPEDRWKTNRETVTVEGLAEDEHLDWVEVNGLRADLSDDGTYSKRIMLDNGENKIKVVAADKAGNQQTGEITVFAKFDAPAIEHLQPTEDKYLDAGEAVKIEMDSEAGVKATFRIHMPLANGAQNIHEFPMMETEAGHYVAYWTAPNNVHAEGAQIEVIARDDYGNVARAEADGQLYINVPED